MTNDAETMRTIKAVLVRFLGDEIPAERLDEVASDMLLSLHGQFYPQNEKTVTPGDSYIIRAGPKGKQIGGLVGGTRVLAGINENGWTPILAHAWIATHLLK